MIPDRWANLPDWMRMVALKCNPIIQTFFSVIDTGAYITFTRPIGYAHDQGVGGAVTQLTSKTTAVTLDKVCGVITTHNEAMGAQDTKSFQVNNVYSHIHDVVILNMQNGGTAGAYRFNARPNDGHFHIDITRGPSGGSLSEALIINYAIIKSSNA